MNEQSPSDVPNVRWPILEISLLATLPIVLIGLAFALSIFFAAWVLIATLPLIVLIEAFIAGSSLRLMVCGIRARLWGRSVLSCLCMIIAATFLIVAVGVIADSAPRHRIKKVVRVSVPSTTQYSFANATRITLNRNWRAERPSWEPEHGSVLEYSLDGQDYSPFDSEHVGTMSQTWTIPVVYVDSHSKVWIRVSETDPRDVGKQLEFAFSERGWSITPLW